MRRPGLAAGLAALLLAAGLVGCASHSDAAAGPLPSAGQYPVATPNQQVLEPPAADPEHYQLVAAGSPVRVRLDGAALTATMSGPDLTVDVPPGGRPPTSAPAVITISFTADSGQVSVPANSFLVLDEEQQPIAVVADSPEVQVGPGAPTALRLSSTLATGHSTVTWQPAGKPMITWDFAVEID